MTVCSASYGKSHDAFKAKCYEKVDSDLVKHEVHTALGEAVIKDADFFTVNVQPICIEDDLVYAITQYGSDDVIIVRDDDYPDIELPEWCANDLIPLGFRKAMALSQTLHEKNVDTYNIKDYEDEENYAPDMFPQHAYLKSIGEPIPIIDRLSLFKQKILSNSTVNALLSFLAFIGVWAVGGLLFAFFNDVEPLPSFFIGAVIGIFYYLIAQFKSSVE